MIRSSKINFNILRRKSEKEEQYHDNRIKIKISLYISILFVFLFFGVFHYSTKSKNNESKIKKTAEEIEYKKIKYYERIENIISKKSNVYIKNIFVENELTFRGNPNDRNIELNKIYYGFVYLNYITLLDEEILSNNKNVQSKLPSYETIEKENDYKNNYIDKLSEIIIWIESKNFVYLTIQLIETAKSIQLERFQEITKNPNYRLFSYQHRIKLYETENIITKMYNDPNNYSTFGIGHKIYTSKRSDKLLLKLLNAVDKNIQDENYKEFILSFIALIYFDYDIHEHEMYFNRILNNKNATISQNVFDAIIFYSFNRGMYGANSDLIEFGTFSKTNNVDRFIQNSLANEYQNALDNNSILTKRRKLEYQMSIPK